MAATKPASKNKKKSTSPSLAQRLSQRRTNLWLFVALFAAVGVYALLRTNANTDIPSDPADIVAAYVQSRPTSLERAENSEAIVYDSHTASYLVLADGSLICDDGTSDQVSTGKLSGGQVKALHNELKQLDL